MSDPYMQECQQVDEEASRLPPTARVAYFERCTSELKDPDTYFALMWVFGLLGGHLFYLGNAVQGFATLMSTLVALALAWLSLTSGNEATAMLGLVLLTGGMAAMMLFHLVSGRHGVFVHNLALKRRILANCQDDHRFTPSRSL